MGAEAFGELIPPGEEAGPSILPVDDEPIARQVLARMLKAEGHHDLSHAARGEGAMEMLRAKASELVLPDVMLPGMNGYDVAARIKGDPARTLRSPGPRRDGKDLPTLRGDLQCRGGHRLACAGGALRNRLRNLRRMGRCPETGGRRRQG